MDSNALRMMIRRAIQGSVITGIAVTGCGEVHTGSMGLAGATGVTAGKDGTTGSKPFMGGTASTGWPPFNPPSGISGGPSPYFDAGSAVIAGRGGPDVAGTGALPANCYQSPVGTCCTRDICLTKEGVAARTGTSPSGDADAGTIDECPASVRLSVCTWWDHLTVTPEGDCCYVETSGSCCGRPLRVGDRTLAAKLRQRTDWLAESAPVSGAIDPITRGELARAWLADARLEHASIASFARFTLHALSVGAPSDLVAGAQQAGLDEVAHARSCFALASRFANEEIGPGEFPMDGILATVTLAEAAAAAVREGCVGETVAAVVAHTQLGWATNPDARAALARISEDEARHAELAYRFVRWAIAAGGDGVRLEVAAAFRDALTALRAEPPRRIGDVAVDVWHDHGRLMPHEERAAWLAAAREVIEPCARELVG